MTSCASILNKETTVVKISSDKKSKIIYLNDTLLISKKQIKLKPIRSNNPLNFSILRDSLKEDISLKRKLSPLFWLNITQNYGLGILVDLTNDKRFTYRHNLHFVTDSITNKMVISNKKISFLPKNKFFLYTSPLQFLDFFSVPMVTLGTEYFIDNNFSLSAEYGFNNSDYNRNYEVSFLDEKNNAYRFETKLYNKINLTNNVYLNEYLAIEFRKIKNEYNDQINYYEIENSNNYYIDDFATKKNVTIFNLKYGLIVPIGKKFYFDFYTGLGLRIKKFDHKNLEYNKNIHQIQYSDNFFLFDTRDFKNYDQKSFFNYSLGFKLGIKL
ncbi:hypothetical protein BW723_11835 [Polaribacter reichenbachii]|uniref:Uncharacterized protein n=3 Tax=Polaribacter reichenbachii TaxID=996801 RepID=A0A1B8TPK6_9FLAO|nr:hypothetical protein BW723_11835 [Polaribacter reichenbachii]OBY61552.1 hypothetical protein LPB301_15940 [Polaribacter reichenbachii]